MAPKASQLGNLSIATNFEVKSVTTILLRPRIQMFSTDSSMVRFHEHQFLSGTLLAPDSRGFPIFHASNQSSIRLSTSRTIVDMNFKARHTHLRSPIPPGF